MRLRYLKAKHWLLVTIMGLTGLASSSCKRAVEDSQTDTVYDVPDPPEQVVPVPEYACRIRDYDSVDIIRLKKELLEIEQAIKKDKEEKINADR